MTAITRLPWRASGANRAEITHGRPALAGGRQVTCCERGHGSGASDMDGTTLRMVVGHPGPSEGITNHGDRATATLQDIWCEKIRGCSYRGSNTSA